MYKIFAIVLLVSAVAQAKPGNLRDLVEFEDCGKFNNWDWLDLD